MCPHCRSIIAAAACTCLAFVEVVADKVEGACMSSPLLGPAACAPATVEQLHIDPDGAPITVDTKVISTIRDSRAELAGRTMIAAMNWSDPYPHPRLYYFSTRSD